MSQARLYDVGEEYIMKTGIATQTLTVGLFNKAQDNLADTADIQDITTEPNGGNYSRQTADFEPTDYSSAFNDDWGFVNINNISFNVSDSTNKIDSYFVAATFQSQDKGDSSPQLHLISSGYLKKTRNLNDGIRQISSITIPANTAGVRLGPRLDGDKLFYLDPTSNLLYTDTISPFDITSTSNSISDDVSSGVDKYNIEFDITGFILLITRSDGQVDQYILNQRYDVSTRELDKTVSLSGDNIIWTAIWNNDGTYLYEISESKNLYQHTVDDAFDVGTISNTTLIDDLPVNSIDQPKGACWNNDGTKYYYLAQHNGEDDDIITYTLNIPWDLTSISNTSSHETRTLTPTNTDFLTGIRFNYDGTKLYVGSESGAPNLIQAELDVAFDVTTVTNTTTINKQIDSVFGVTLNTLPKYLGAG